MPLRTRPSATAREEDPVQPPAASPTARPARAVKSNAERKAVPAPAPPEGAKRAASKVPASPAKGTSPAKDSKTPAPAAAKATQGGARRKAAPAAPGRARHQGRAACRRPAQGLAKKASPAKAVPKKISGGYSDDDQGFLEQQREALAAERVTYLEQAHSLKAEAESLVEEMEPGDIQFDEESGEGGTVTVDRERDLALSAQALLAVEEIDDALAKIAKGSYGVCEGCGELIGKPRLEALPYARLCIACKSGGLSRR